MNDWAPRIALAATAAAALVVLLVYTPGLDAPFLVPKFTALEAAASLGFLALVLRRREAGGPRWSPPAAVCAWLVVATSVLSWAATRGQPEGAPYAVDAMARWLGLFGLACGASVLEARKEQRQRLAEAVTFGAGAVATLGLIQHFDLLPLPSLPIISLPGSTFGNRNLAAEIMAMALPFGVAITFGPWRDTTIIMGAATALELVFLGVTRTRGSWIGAACGLGFVLFLIVVRRRVSRAVVLAVLGALGIALVIAALPARKNTRDVGDTKRYASVLTVIEEGFDAKTPALRTRLGLYRRSLSMIRDYPLLGVGPGNWPVMFPRYAEPGASEDGILFATLAPRQAHDDFLERGAETGLVGMAALLALGVTVARAARRRLAEDSVDAGDAGVTTGAIGSLVALIGLGVSSFPLEMPGTLTLAGLALGLVVTGGGATSDRGPAPDFLRRVAPLAVALALLVAVSVRGEHRFRASRALAEGETALHAFKGATGAEIALPMLRRSIEANPTSYMAHLRTAQMFLRQRRGDDAVAAAQEVIAIEPYSPNGWGVLAAAYRVAGDSAESRDAATRGLELMHDYPLALDVRADALDLLGDPAAANADRARIREIAERTPDDATRNTARGLSTPER